MEATNAVIGASMPSKPIVSDVTVCSRGEESEGTSKEEGRDENGTRHYEEEEENREGEKDGKRMNQSKSTPTRSVIGNKAKQTSGANVPTMHNRYQYPPGNRMGHQQPQRSAPFPMNRGPYGPPPYFPGSSSFGGPPQHHGHPPHPPFHPGGPHHVPHHPNHHPHHGHHPMMQPPHYQGGYPMNQGNSYPSHHPTHGPPPPYGGPYAMPPFHGVMSHSYLPSSNIVTNMSTDSISISSSRSKSSRNSSKKRAIETVASAGTLPAAYAFRRTDSASSSTSTVTAGNNTSAEASGGSPQKQKSLDPDLGQQPQRRYHRRDYSGTSTASSLSVGGYSLASYEGPRVGATEDAMLIEAPLLTNSPKRRKGDEREPLLVDTGMRPESVSSHSVDADQSSRFEQLSIDASKMPPSTSSASSAGQDRTLFLSLSTSPINNDIDATPVSKNTNKQKGMKADQQKGSIFKPKIDTSAAAVADRPSDTPTPPVHGELGSAMTDEHSMLNNHLRNQSFTPLHHLTATGSSGNSPTNTGFASAIQPQLSWSIAGDTPSLGDLADWEEEHKGANKNAKDDQKARPSSTTSTDTRNMMISPHDFQFWKDDHEHDIIEASGQGVSGTTTPLPVFFGQSIGDGSENHLKMDHSKKVGESEHIHHMFMSNGRPVVAHGAGLKPNNKPIPLPVWSKHHDPSGMPPTPVFHGSEYREDCFGPRSPMAGDRRDMDYYHFSHLGPHGHNDRVRNLRGRLPPGGHLPPIPIHIPPHMSAHLPMTSPMGLGHKAGLWSPHHPGMPPPMGSPSHMGSPLSIMAQSRRKCVPLKPPIPSKFQGDMDKSKSALVPEFTNLVNFPGHMSQKQSVNLPEGMRCCVMCGQACPCSSGNKCKKVKKPNGSEGPMLSRSGSQDQLGDKNSGFAIIPTQNKGLCTLCDVNVWVVVSSGLEIKWCKGCKNFRPWAAFGDKGLATKCLRCRERQREKYALQKEEKEKTRVPSKTKSK